MLRWQGSTILMIKLKRRDGCSHGIWSCCRRKDIIIMLPEHEFFSSDWGRKIQRNLKFWRRWVKSGIHKLKWPAQDRSEWWKLVCTCHTGSWEERKMLIFLHPQTLKGIDDDYNFTVIFGLCLEFLNYQKYLITGFSGSFVNRRTKKCWWWCKWL